MAAISLSRAALATRLAFFCAGFAISCWAPLIPLAKLRVGADEAQLGLLLLCLGVGSVIAMTVTGWVAARFGARPMIVFGGLGLALTLPLLLLASTQWQLGVLLWLFGASLGTIDVAMNLHAVEVETRAKRPLMSGFHAFYSIGGIVGAGAVSGLLALGASGQIAGLAGGLLALASILAAMRGLLRSDAGASLPFALPRGVVVLLAVLAAITFLIEGAVLDWGALLILERGLADVVQGGLGYVAFSVTMTLGRLTGDRVIARLGAFRVLVAGGGLAIAGIAMTLLLPGLWQALTGFALIGLGASNLVPILFSVAGRQTVMPVGLAVAAVTTTGYAGVLLGPAAIGLVAEVSSLSTAFWLLAVLMAAVPLSASRILRG